MSKVLFVEKGIDLEDSTIYLTGEVNDEMYTKVVTALALMSDSNEIIIMLNTEGGDFYQSLAIYDLLKMESLRGKKIKVICTGPVMSAGVIILQAATERIALKNAQLLVHYGEDGNDSATTARHNDKMFKLMKRIVGERATVTPRTLGKWFNQESYFTAIEAKKSGLIDRIAGETNE
jgi:ATP-dependent protease ClpP protease subunit